MTAAETALHQGGRINGELVALLAGHERKGLAFSLYSDWVKMGRAGFRGQLRDRLRTLREAVEDVVELGFEEDVKGALRETEGDRPAVARTAPAFRRGAGR